MRRLRPDLDISRSNERCSCRRRIGRPRVPCPRLVVALYRALDDRAGMRSASFCLLHSMALERIERQLEELGGGQVALEPMQLV
jgi:hypothetical protein